MLPCCLVPDILPCALDWPFAFHLYTFFSCLDHCLCTWISPLVKPSRYCSPIEDHARLLEYSSALPSIYLFAICSTLPVYLTMSINKSLHMDTHSSRLVRPVTEYLAAQGSSSSSSEEHWPGMDTAHILLALKQGPRSLEDYIRKYVAIAHYSDLTDCLLIEFFVMALINHYYLSLDARVRVHHSLSL